MTKSLDYDELFEMIDQHSPKVKDNRKPREHRRFNSIITQTSQPRLPEIKRWRPVNGKPQNLTLKEESFKPKKFLLSQSPFSF